MNDRLKEQKLPSPRSPRNFKIRSRKTFSLDQNLKNSKTWGKNSSKLNFSSFLENRRWSSTKARRKSSIVISTFDLKTAEEEIKSKILEMRRVCLWEIRNYNFSNEESISPKNNSIQNDDDKIKPLIKFATKYLNNSSSNDSNSNNSEIIKSNIGDNIDNKEIKKMIKRCPTFSKKKLDKKIFDMEQSTKENLHEINNKNNDKKTNFNKNNINGNNFNKNNDNINNIEIKLKKLRRSKTTLKKRKIKTNLADKFRFLCHRNIILDSFDEDESDEDNDLEGNFINPESNFIFIFDFFIALSTIYSLIIFPYELMKSYCICDEDNNIFFKYINLFIDVLFLLDLIKNFFLGYYTKDEEKLIKNNKKIAYNYLKGWFILDLLSSIPFNLISYLYCNNYNKKNINFNFCDTYIKNDNKEFLLILKCLKSIKTLKIWQRKKNKFITDITEKIADDILSDNILSTFIKIFFLLSGLHVMSTLFIFIGKHSYPNWIFKQNFQENDLLSLYIISIYYITTTISTVGYGDIQPYSFLEIIFQIIALGVGTVIYSWLISSISNGIHKQSFASINYEKECKILEEIKRTNNKMSYDIYLNIQKYLELKHFHQEKYDKNLLMNSLPYNLKNSLIFNMYNKTLNGFHIFKGISNSNFVIDVLNSFIPAIAKKNDILINENDKIENYIFVREGILCLEITINLDTAEESINNKFLSNDFLSFAEDIENEIPTASMISKNNLSINTIFDSHINFLGKKNSSFMISSNTEQKTKEKTKQNIINLKIHDVHKNEDYGGFFMYTGRRSPFLVRVKSKIADLYVIKSIEYSKLLEQYPNIWNRINKKNMYNIRQIKNVLIKTISQFCETKGIKIYDFYHDIIKKAIKACNKDLIPFKKLRKSIGIELENKFDTEKNFNSSEDEESENDKKSINNENNSNKQIQKIKKTKTTKIKSSDIPKKNLMNFTKTTHILKSNMLNKLLNSQKKDSNTSSNFSIKNKTTKKQRHSKIKTKISTNCKLDFPLRKITFNFSESDDSVDTVRIDENRNNIENNNPNTMKALPQSLINILRMKIKYQQLLNQKENSESEITNYHKENNILDSEIQENNINKNNNENCINSNNFNSSNNNKNSKIIDINTDNLTNAEKYQSNFFHYNRNIKISDKSMLMSNNKSSLNSIPLQYKTSWEASKITNMNNNNNIPNSSSFTFNNQELVNKRRISLVKNSSIRDSIAPFDSSNLSNDIIIETDENNNEENETEIKNIPQKLFKFKKIFNKKKFPIYNGWNRIHNNFLFNLNKSFINKSGTFNYKNDYFIATNVESFEISASYDNINELAGGIYIENYKFQKETKKFIKTFKIQNKFRFSHTNYKYNSPKPHIPILKYKFIKEDNNTEILQESPNKHLKSVFLKLKNKKEKLKKCTSFINTINKKEYFNENKNDINEHIKNQKNNISRKSIKGVKNILKCHKEKINSSIAEENNDTFIKLVVNNETIGINATDDEINKNKNDETKKNRTKKCI